MILLDSGNETLTSGPRALLRVTPGGEIGARGDNGVTPLLFGLEKAGGPQPPAAEARSHLFAALRRLRPADLCGGFIFPLDFAGGPQ